MIFLTIHEYSGLTCSTLIEISPISHTSDILITAYLHPVDLSPSLAYLLDFERFPRLLLFISGQQLKQTLVVK
jgi:hypothetical protein